MSASSLTIRPATPRDAADIVVLTDMAGHGLPSYLWANALVRGDAASTLDYGRSRALREDADFSWRNAWLAELDGAVAGLLLGYRQPDEMEPPDTSRMSPVIAPLAELEPGAPGTWYVNVVAVYPEFRGRGVAAALLAEAQELAQSSAASGLSLIVQDDNDSAIRAYQRAGYRVTARRPFVPFPGASAASEWLLMVAAI